LLIVNGLPANPVVRAAIDVSFGADPLGRFAVSEDGMVVLLSFSSSSADQDFLYRWTPSTGPRFLTKATRITDLAFFGEDAVVLDSGNDQVLLVLDVRGAGVTTLIGDFRSGISQPVAVSVSSRNEIYVGNASNGTVVVLDPTGRQLRTVFCGCAITTMAPVPGAALRLTDRLDRPVFVLERDITEDRVLFIPALAVDRMRGVVP
jgi:hypothetical protein